MAHSKSYTVCSISYIVIAKKSFGVMCSVKCKGIAKFFLLKYNSLFLLNEGIGVGLSHSKPS